MNLKKRKSKAPHQLILFLLLLSFVLGILFIFQMQKQVMPKQSDGTTSIVSVSEEDPYIIAVFGDSMVDTMGEPMEYLQQSLLDRYPQTSFTLYNYGVGRQNIQQGLTRFDSPLDYKNRHYPSIPDLHPDIIIVGSFAYNPFVPHDRDRYKAMLTQVLQKAKNITQKVYLLVEVAPIQKGFGKGAHGVNWPEQESLKQAKEITEQLDDAVAVGAKLGVPVINAYSVTKARGNYGSGLYTNSGDGIHPSTAGHTLTANLIAESLNL